MSYQPGKSWCQNGIRNSLEAGGWGTVISGAVTVNCVGSMVGIWVLGLDGDVQSHGV